jgi:hypothetical protein
MIDFKKLLTLAASARDIDAGKPLDNVGSIHKGSAQRGWGGNLRNCRLFRISPDVWRIELHGNVISTITRLSDERAKVVVGSVSEWPTNTTAARLMAILGIPVMNNRKAIRFASTNFQGTHRGDYPPMDSRQEFIIDANGTHCTNPYLCVERRTRVNRERAKTVYPHIASLRKLGTVMASIGAIAYDDILALHKERFVHGFLDFHDLGDATSDLVNRVVAIGPHVRIHPWERRQMEGDKVGKMVPPDLALEFFKAGLAKYKGDLYHALKINESYEFTYASQFKEFKHD